MKEATKLPELPRLQKGQGTLIYTHGNKILYRKAIPVDGGYKRLAVTGNNIRECFDTMRRKEDDLRAGMKSAGSESLAMAIDRWLDLYKQPEVKPSSYDRLRITYKAQITKMTIADKPWKLITADELQAAVNALVQDGYAWSTVKKAYDMLNAFYTFQTRRGLPAAQPNGHLLYAAAGKYAQTGQRNRLYDGTANQGVLRGSLILCRGQHPAKVPLWSGVRLSYLYGSAYRGTVRPAMEGF